MITDEQGKETSEIIHTLWNQRNTIDYPRGGGWAAVSGSMAVFFRSSLVLPAGAQASVQEQELQLSDNHEMHGILF